jgi:lysozyme
MVVTGEQARNMILKELTQFEVGVSKFVTVPLNDNEFAALVSFSYNLGLGSLQHSTLLQKLNAGDRAGAAVEFLKWNHAGGQVLAGLTRRRLAEHDLFLAAVDNSNTPGNSNGLPPPPTDDEILDDLKSHE